MLISFPPIYEHKFTCAVKHYIIEGEERALCGLNNAGPDQSPAIVMCLRTKSTYIDVCPWRFDSSIAQAESDSLPEKEQNPRVLRHFSTCFDLKSYFYWCNGNVIICLIWFINQHSITISLVYKWAYTESYIEPGFIDLTRWGEEDLKTWKTEPGLLFSPHLNALTHMR